MKRSFKKMAQKKEIVCFAIAVLVFLHNQVANALTEGNSEGGYGYNYDISLIIHKV